MNLKKYIRNHETFIKNQLLVKDCDYDWIVIRAKHERVINYMQHERLVHLLVTLAFGMYLLISTVIAMVKPCHQSIVLMGLFLVMLAPYTAYYFFLENTVQRWYKIMDAIDNKIDDYRIAVNTENREPCN